MQNYSLRQGLAQSQVTKIFQDKDGYLWFGTRDGISKFDGHTFTNYTKNNYLTGNDVMSGLQDREGNLWFGFINGTVSYYEWQTKQFKSFKIPGKDAIKYPEHVWDIFQDKEGNIWFAIPGYGICRYDGTSAHHIKTSSGLPDSMVYSITQDGYGNFWFVMGNGIYSFNPVSQEYDSLSVPADSPIESVMEVYSDRNNNIWMGTSDQGLIRYKPDAEKNKYDYFTKKDGLASDIILSIYEDNVGNIWVGCDKSGVSKYIPGKTKGDKGFFRSITHKNGLPPFGVYSVFQDKEENYWFGTNGAGVVKLRFHEKSLITYTENNGLLENSIWSVFFDSYKGIWIGCNRGLTYVKRVNEDGALTNIKHFTEFDGKAFNSVRNFYEDSKGDIWFAVDYVGLLKWTRINNSIQPFRFPDYLSGDFVTSVMESKPGHYWFTSTGSGLLYYNIYTKEFTQFNTEDSSYTTDVYNFIFKDSKNDLWFITKNNGCLRLSAGKWKNFTPEQGWPNSIASITEDHSGNLWFTTRDNRFYKYDGRKVFDLTTSKGLESEALYSVIADSNTIWVGTTRGIACYRQNDSSFVQYGYREGFPIDETNENAIAKDWDGNLWFGTIGGAIRFIPGMIIPNPTPPQTYIRRVQIFLGDDPLPADNRFDYSDNHLTFHYIGLSFSAPNMIKYRYKIEGIDREWSPETKATSATYSNLMPGTFTFKVIACNNAGIWNEEPTEYRFEILAPFWLTWWFLGLTVIALIIAVFIIIRIRIHAIENDRRILEQKVKERTLELRQEKEEVEKGIKALHQSEHKFRSYTEAASSGIYIHQQNSFKYINRAGQQISGYSREELMKMNIWDLVHPDYLQMLKERFRARIAGEKISERYEFKIINKSGEERWLDFSGRVIEYENEPAVIAAVFDITERKITEEALREEKERLAVTLRSIGDGVITTDMNGKIIIVNNEAEKITGWSQKDAQDKSLGEIFKIKSSAGKNISIDPIEEILEANFLAVDDKTSVLISGDQKEYIISYNSSIIRDESSKSVGVVLAFRDITETWQMEQELLKAQKLESIGILAGGIAHDFNNILTAIMGNLSLAQMHIGPDEPIYDYIIKAEKASSRAQDLTQQLLTFSKGGTPVRKAASIKDLITDSVDFVLKGSNVKCKLDFSENLKPVSIDEGQISQVFHNLVINADQAMPDGGVINITVKNLQLRKKKSLPLPAGDYIQISVQDEGIGIPKDLLNKVFDPFFTTKQTGSGLGLATTYSIINKHQGHISVDSVLGDGTRFTIYLPASEKTPESITTDSISEKITEWRGKILIMDDEKMILETSQALLEHLGFTTQFALNGEEAINTYKSAFDDDKKFDLVIMDLTIPGGMGGKDAVIKLREFDLRAKVVVSSGYSTDPIMARFKEYGFDGRLKKPFNIKEITEVLESLNLAENNT